MLKVFAVAIAALLLTPFAAFAQGAGTLISSEPMPGAPFGAHAWRIRYVSSDDGGRREEITGVVVTPRGPAPADGYPVIAWAHGTWGVAGKCQLSSADWFTSTPALNEMLARGYAVVATDYAGLGTPQPHAYLVGRSAAHWMLDSVRAARAIPQAHIGNRYVTWGESQGGHASLWAGLEARRYAPELELVGVAAAAPPTDLIENLTGGSDPSIRAFLTAYTAHSWSQHFGAPLSRLGNRQTAGIITRLAQNNCIKLGGKPKLGMALGVLVLRRDLKKVDLGTIQPWARIARDNSVAAASPGVPVLIAQSAKDVIVGPAITAGYARRLCKAGARVRYVPITAGDGHATSARDSATVTLNWMDARFAGKLARSDCGRI